MKTIGLTKGMVCIVDDEDYAELSKYKWCVSKSSVAYYAGRGIWIPEKKSSTIIYMHRMILDAPDGMLVDHINGNTLDNRRSNLRLCTRYENQHNMRPRGNGTKGVHLTKSRLHLKTPWHAYITLEGKRQHIGYFDSQEAAQSAYNKCAGELFGDFAFPVEVKCT